MSLKRELDTQAGAYQAFRPKKKHRVYTNEDAQLAKIFDNLSSELRNVQLDAAIDLIKSFNENGQPEKIIIRLIRGLCSSRKAARPGFFIALTQVFKSMLESDDKSAFLGDSLALIKKYTEAERGAAKSEKKEHTLGRLAAYSSLIHSHAIFRVPENSKDGDVSPCFDDFLQSLLRVSTNAPHLNEQCGKLLVDIVVHAAAAGATSYVERLLVCLHKCDLLHTPNGLAVWMEALKSTPDITFPSGVWEKNDPFRQSEVYRLTKALSNDYKIVESANMESDGGTKNANYGIARREHHFVWQVVFDTLIAMEQSDQKRTSKKHCKSNKHVMLKEFWLLAVDEPHFAPECSPERKAIGFRIFASAIKMIPDKIFDHILSPQLLRCLVNQYADADRYLHEIASDIIERLVGRTRSPEYPLALRNVVLALLHNKDHAQDKQARVARTNTLVNRFLHGASSEAVKLILPEFERIIEQAVSHKQGVNSHHISEITVIASQVAILFREIGGDADNTQLPRLLIMGLLRDLAFEHRPENLINVHKSARTLPLPYRRIFRAQLWVCVKDVLDKTSLEELIHERDLALISDAAGIERLPPLSLSTSELETLKSARITYKELKFKSTSPNSKQPEVLARQQALFILLSLTFLQLCCEEQGSMAALKDVLECIIEYDTEKTNFDSIVDNVIASLSQSDSIFRIAAERIFTAFTPLIAAEGLAPMFHILSREENISGQRDLFDQQPDGNEDDGCSNDSASDAEESTDVEVVGVKAREDDSDQSNCEDTDEESTSSNHSANESEANSNDEALNATLGEILRTHNQALVPTNNDKNSDSNSDLDSDSDMTDSAMESLNIDAQLATIFQQRAAQSYATAKGKGKPESKKATQLEAKRLIVMFKARILSLLNIYIATQFPRPDCLAVILPLCQLIGSTRNIQIAKKADDALERYIKTAKKKHGLPVQVGTEEAWSILGEVHEEALLYRSKLHAAACGRGALFLARVLVEKARGESGKVVEMEVGEVVEKLEKRFQETRARKEELGSLLPESFWGNWRIWLASMALK